MFPKAFQNKAIQLELPRSSYGRRRSVAAYLTLHRRSEGSDLDPVLVVATWTAPLVALVQDLSLAQVLEGLAKRAFLIFVPFSTRRSGLIRLPESISE